MYRLMQERKQTNFKLMSNVIKWMNSTLKTKIVMPKKFHNCISCVVNGSTTSMKHLLPSKRFHIIIFLFSFFSLNLPIILWSVLNDRNNFRWNEEKTTITSCNEIENSSGTKKTSKFLYLIHLIDSCCS